MDEITLTPPPDPWAKLPALAERLGVKQCQSAGVVIQTAKGEKYDVFELVHAALDRLELVTAVLDRLERAVQPK